MLRLLSCVLAGALFAASGADAAEDRGSWFADAKFGMFVHWGLYSIPGQGEWVMSRNGLSVEEYHALVEKWNPAVGAEASWVKLAAESGVRYMVFTTRHHDGFSLFGSKFNDFNSVRSPARRDHVRAYVEACRKYGMKPPVTRDIFFLQKTLANFSSLSRFRAIIHPSGEKDPRQTCMSTPTVWVTL